MLKLGKEGYWIKCVHCGKGCQAERSTKKYCSRACARSYQRQSKRESRKLARVQTALDAWRESVDLKAISDEDMKLLRDLRGSLDGLLGRTIQLKQETQKASSNKVEMSATQLKLLSLMETS